MARYGRSRSKYLVCVNCRRVYTFEELERERRERNRERITCPFCGSINFSKTFTNVVMIAEPEKSKVAAFLKIVHPGTYAYKF